MGAPSDGWVVCRVSNADMGIRSNRRELAEIVQLVRTMRGVSSDRFVDVSVVPALEGTSVLVAIFVDRDFRTVRMHPARIPCILRILQNISLSVENLLNTCHAATAQLRQPGCIWRNEPPIRRAPSSGVAVPSWQARSQPQRVNPPAASGS